jgi:hypothetical protein
LHPQITFLRNRIWIAVAVLSLAGIATLRAGTSVRVNLTPRFSADETLVYQIEIHTATTGKTVTPIANDEGATQSSIAISMRERLQVLAVDQRTDGQAVTFRLTWDDSHADASSDAVDATAPDPAAPFAKLAGQTVQFTLAPDGSLSNFKGLEDVVAGGIPPAEAVSWIASLLATTKFPKGGVLVGQQWKAEQPIGGAPLAGLFWQNSSTYQRDEACALMAPASDAANRSSAPSAEECAVIVSQMTVSRHGSTKADATPDDYLHNGLRTSGSWTGTGQELGSIALKTGLLMSATESSTQNVDYQIKSASTGSTIHYTAKVENQTGITLVEESKVRAINGQ